MAMVMETKPVSAVDCSLPVFRGGIYTPITKTVDPSDQTNSPPNPLFIVAPIEAGTYGVILFLPGTYLGNQDYSKLFQHTASHGFIVVAPKLYKWCPPTGNKEVERAATVANWLSSGLQSHLPENVEPNLSFLTLAGHSRGGSVAFALALGKYATQLDENIKFSALIGVDPVAGLCKSVELDPPILSDDYFNFTSPSMPVTVIGTGLGGVRKCCIACAPECINHDKFFRRCTSTRAHFDATNFGHMDVLDDELSIVSTISRFMCKSGACCERFLLRRCVGGIIVAFLKKFFEPDNPEGDDFMTIVQNPSVAPIKMDQVEFIAGRN